MKRITAIALFAAASALGAGHALAQDHAVQATMPFDFTVGNKLLPQGRTRSLLCRTTLLRFEATTRISQFSAWLRRKVRRSIAASSSSTNAPASTSCAKSLADPLRST